MRPLTFPELNEDDENANYPNCVDAIDGKQIRVIYASDSGSLCFNYKKYFSIVVFAVFDADHKFT